MFKLLYDSKYYLLGKDLFNNTEGRTTLNILFWDNPKTGLLYST